MIHPRALRVAVLAALGALAMSVGVARSDGPGEASGRARRTVERSLAFLEQDARTWRKAHGCATCHHGVMTAWALAEAKREGYPVERAVLEEMITWAKDRFVPRPGQSVSPQPGRVPTLAAALLSQATFVHPAALSPDELARIAAQMVGRQMADGAWSTPPLKNGPPPVFESRETMTLWIAMTLDRSASVAYADASAAREAFARAVSWLETNEPADTTQAHALRLLMDVRAGRGANDLRSRVDRLLARQQTDGGWAQAPDLGSDAYATGQALYILRAAGVPADRADIRRAVTFLVERQRDDGSWPMTSRAQQGHAGSTNPVPITYFGSAWATLGLVRGGSR